MMRELHVKLKPEFPWQNNNSQEQDCFNQPTEFKFKEKTSKRYIWRIVIKFEHVGK
jgi:hypothetical protein